mmetsp:Transcript_50700/g.91050  ORF Transcript_50700/g.91050 Transcript_50700/m.91050 type:complete len:104 (+) Transcript_50700:112-423(+)
MGDTVRGEEEHTTVELPPLRQEAAPEVATEVVQGPPLPTEYVQGLVTQSDSLPVQTMPGLPLSSRTLSPQPLATAPMSMSPCTGSSGVPSVSKLSCLSFGPTR